MDNGSMDEKIDAYLLGKLHETEEIAFEEELFRSPELLQVVRLREQLIKVIGEKKNEPDKRDFYRWPTYSGIAAILLLLIFFISSLLKTPLPASFAVNKDLEGNINKKWRNNPGDTINIFSPTLDENFQDDILFKWKTSLHIGGDNKELILYITDNQNNRINNSPIYITGQEYKLSISLQPGLYYWELIDPETDEPIYFSKFTYQKPSTWIPQIF